MMRTYLFTILSLLFVSMSSVQVMNAQETVVPEGYALVDSVIYRPAAVMDSTLVGRNIYSVLAEEKGTAEVKVIQPIEMEMSMAGHIASNAERTISGYRVRIFFDNRQTARTDSEETLKKFEGLYHDVSAYRSYVNPYFKVTVGDFRTKSEAMELLERIKGEFPSAFVVRENISFPVVDKNDAFVTDTVKVLRPVSANRMAL